MGYYNCIKATEIYINNFTFITDMRDLFLLQEAEARCRPFKEKLLKTYLVIIHFRHTAGARMLFSFKFTSR